MPQSLTNRIEEHTSFAVTLLYTATAPLRTMHNTIKSLVDELLSSLSCFCAGDDEDGAGPRPLVVVRLSTPLRVLRIYTDGTKGGPTNFRHEGTRGECPLRAAIVGAPPAFVC
jgi:hypothetical protein